MAQNLDELRQDISATDLAILELLAKRQQLTNQVARTKIAIGMPVRDQAREEYLLVRLVKQAREFNLDPHFVTQLFHVIIEDSVLNQQALLAQHANPHTEQLAERVAYLGDKGSYSYLATHKYFNRRTDNIIELGCHSFAEILSKVAKKEANYGVLPIENTTSGSINEVYDQLQHTDLHVVGEVTHPIKHSLLINQALTADISDIQQIYAHPQVFSQCSHFLADLGNVQVHACESTSHAMIKVRELNSPHVAAIGSANGGELYGLKVIKSNLANQVENHSRFIVVARDPVTVPLQVPAKTMMTLSTVQTPGALVDALLVFKNNNINITKLESRPINGNPWEEMFYIDVEGNIQDGPMQQTVESLQEMTRSFRLLGCYPVETVNPTKIAAVNALAE